MRLLHKFLLIGVAGPLLAAPAAGQKADDQIAPRSVALLNQGQALLAQGKFMAADDAFETALAVDPRNRAAFVAMARVATKEKLFGQAIRFTNKALQLEPTDRDALVVQGEAMVELGALPRARENLAKLQKLCPSGCAQVALLNTAITRGPTVAAAQPKKSAPKTK
ncbi:MAG: hypothetical protein ABIW16_05325 [Sphingomicrobium sp.]